MHFLREELQEKSVLLGSLIITNNNQKYKTSDKTPENPTPTLQSKENNSDTKEFVPSTKDDVISMLKQKTQVESHTKSE